MKLLEAWTVFLNSLATRGGAVFTLSWCCVGLLAFMLHMLHHGEASTTMETTISAMLSGFSGALLLALKGSSDSSATATTSTPAGTVSTATSTDGTASLNSAAIPAQPIKQ